MTGRERKILRAERHLKEIQELLDSIPQRIRSQLPEGTNGDAVIAFLAESLKKDIEKTRDEMKN